MGCGVSKEAKKVVVAEETTSDVPSSYGTPKQLSQSLPGSQGAGVAVPPPPPPSHASSAPGELRPEHQIVWRLHLKEGSPIETFNIKELELIKEAARMSLGVRKCTVGLYGPERVWLKNATGGFSPAVPFKDTISGKMYAAFQESEDKVPFVLVIPDLRRVPRLKDHPSVTERPHVVFTASALIVTRTGAGQGHALGLFSLWDSLPCPPFTPEQEERLAVAAAAARVALQRELFSSLGLDPDEANNATEPPELPAVWIDAADPNWRVVGINPAWETLTGVELGVMEDFPGLLAVMVPSDGRDAARLRHVVGLAMAQLPPRASLPLILSPCAPAASMMQYVMALRRVEEPPPLPASEPASTSAGASGADPWLVECHACLRADDFRANYSSDESTAPLRGGSHDGSLDGSESSELASTPSSGQFLPTPAALIAPCIPPRLASLHLGQLLGIGSYGNVYAGRLLDCPVAVKIIRHSYGPDAPKADWLDHYEALSNVDMTHNNLIATLDWARMEDVDGWSVWIVQELAEKGSLSVAIARGVLREGGDPDGPVDMRAVLNTAREIACGMRYLHSMNEIHSDLSSNNVVLVTAANARGFVAKVSDFGLSRPEGATVLTQTAGTVTHMAPELLAEGRTSKSTDVFSFGVILWELWTGKQAWAGLGSHQVIFAVSCRGELIKMPPDAPEDYAKLATECMAPSHNDRPSFNEIVPRIDAMLAALGPLSSPAASSASLSSRGVLF